MRNRTRGLELERNENRNAEEDASGRNVTAWWAIIIENSSRRSITEMRRCLTGSAPNSLRLAAINVPAIFMKNRERNGEREKEKEAEEGRGRRKMTPTRMWTDDLNPLPLSFFPSPLALPRCPSATFKLVNLFRSLFSLSLSRVLNMCNDVSACNR